MISQPRPPPSLPPHPILVYNFSGKIWTGYPVWARVLVKLLAWLLRAKTYPLLQSFLLYSFSPNKFLSSFGKLYFRISNPLLLHSSRCTPSIEPQPAMFLRTVCQPFCQPSEPCSNLCFSFCSNGQWREGVGGGGRGDAKRVDLCLNTDFSLIRPAQIVLFNPLHCNEKSIHAAGNHHWSRQNIRLIRTVIHWNNK